MVSWFTMVLLNLGLPWLSCRMPLWKGKESVRVLSECSWSQTLLVFRFAACFDRPHASSKVLSTGTGFDLGLTMYTS